MGKASKDKLAKFNLSQGKIGRIPSNQQKNSSTYIKFINELGVLIDEKVKEQGIGISSGTVYVFIAQILNSPNEYQTCDVDNMLKTVLDLLTNRCYKDDGQVTSLLITKHLREGNKDDFYFLGVKYLGKTNDPGGIQKEGLYEAEELYKTLINKKNTL